MSLLANFLTLLRIAMIPFIIWGFMLDDKDFGAKLVLVLFFAASFTDYLDGKIARKFNATSDFGRMLDPIADKMLVTVMLIMLVFDRSANPEGVLVPRADLIPVLIIIMREILVSGLREFLAAEGILMAVTKLAKWKTTVQFAALVCLLASPLADGIEFKGTPLYFQQLGQLLLWIAAIITFITGWQYFRHTLKAAFKGKKIFQIKLQDEPEDNLKRDRENEGF